MASVDPIEEPSLGDEYERRTLVDVLRSVQERAMPVPLQNPTSLPLHQLDPEVFERVMAEVIARQHNLGTYFYGRRGQTQYGLDIVEHETDSRRSLYQVKRYQSVTTRGLDAIVQEYADEPRRAPTAKPPRRFDPWRLVIAISTPIEADTALIDQVAKLQDAYKGDLVIEAWGIEAISRKLRDAGALVNAVFGPAWAKAWCGFELGSQPVRDPDPMGLLEGPVVALHLDSIEADADRDEAERPSMAAQAFGVIADALESSGFPSHARRLRQRQAKALQSAGDEARAFRILFHLCLDRFLGGDTFAPSQIHDMEQMLGTKERVRPPRQQRSHGLLGGTNTGPTSVSSSQPFERSLRQTVLMPRSSAVLLWNRRSSTASTTFLHRTRCSLCLMNKPQSWRPSSERWPRADLTTIQSCVHVFDAPSQTPRCVPMRH